MPAGAVAAHIFEEFVWPGGFAAWYRHYPPGQTVTVTTQFLLLMNAVLVALALIPPILGTSPRGLAFWIVVAAIAAVNAVFHMTAAVRTHAYSPGVVTGVVVYLPLALIGGTWFLHERLVASGTVAQGLLIAVAYQMCSTWKHGRNAASRRE
jgi:hypothetical protein